MFRNDWAVDKGIRPAGAQDRCFYCGALKGEQHRSGCTMRTRTVVVEVSFQLLQSVPEDWDRDMIEFHMNESSSCADNLIEEISKQAERVGCACGLTNGRYLREASEDDELQFKKHISEAES